MPYMQKHEERVIELIDGMFASKLALIKIRHILREALDSGTLIKELEAEPGLSLIEYINRHIKND